MPADDTVEFCDEFAGTVGWIHPKPAWMSRAGHAVSSGGGVWIIDPILGQGVLERIVSLGVAAGVVQLLDRHNRDCAEVADALGVPHYKLPFRGVADAPFRVIPIVRAPWWKEVALWFESERTLVCADVLTNASGYSAPNERLGVHPMLRFKLPRHLAELPTERLLLGHGEGIDGPEAQEAIAEAVRVARRNLPAVALGGLKLPLQR